MNDLTIVILAAGLGTRMRSRKAKVLHEAAGFALVEHVVRSARALTTPDRICVVVGHQAERVRELLTPYGVTFAQQTEQLGTGHAVKMCRPVVGDRGGRVVILYGDCPLLEAATVARLVEKHAESGAAATVITAELANPYGYGRILLNDRGDVDAIVEEKVATPEQKAVRLINSGIYCFESSLLWDALEHVTPNPVSKEFYLTDIVEILNANGHRVASHVHANPDELLGINTRVELAQVDALFCRRKVTEVMLSGVTVQNPDSVRIEADVQVGKDTVLGPSVQLLGSTRVGEDCKIGAGAVLRDAAIGNGVEIEPYTIVNRSTIGDGASVGPFARLRMDNEVGPGAHIGNFVELKKTKFRAGAKAGHLAYLGDSDIGAKTNIGAGTITCNYDGKHKHQTQIGEGAFVGSNSTLVAPVHLGRESYVAAGSVITDAVPEESLGIGRGRQVNKEGWVSKRRNTAASSTKA